MIALLLLGAGLALIAFGVFAVNDLALMVGLIVLVGGVLVGLIVLGDRRWPR